MRVLLQWDPVPSVWAIRHYTVTVDDALPLTLPAELCTATACELPLTLAAGAHTFRLTATNALGTSDPVTLTADIPTRPATPRGLRLLPKDE